MNNKGGLNLKKMILIFTLVCLTGVFVGCNSTQLEEIFEIETVEQGEK